MKVSIVVAYDRNRAIGIENQLPWHIPADLKHFREITLGKPVVMGRKTFDSLGKPLKDRLNIVISSKPEKVAKFEEASVEVCNTFEQALDFAKRSASESGVDEIMVIGGAKVFEVALDVADYMYITEIDGEYEADVTFPEPDENVWAQDDCRLVPSSLGTPSLKFLSMKRVPEPPQTDRAKVSNLAAE